MNTLTSLKVIIPMLSLACLLCGCKSTGRDFKYQNTESLELGQTRNSEYQVMFGKPKTIETKETTDGKYESIVYIYAYADLGTVRTRALSLEFRDGVLNAYSYVSSFDKGKTVMNTDQVKQVTRGVSKKSDVLQILGKPHGMARCPTQAACFKDKCGKGTEIWTWSSIGKASTFGVAYGFSQIPVHTIFISFDKDGVVTDVESTQTNKGK